jgi:WhiB family redox-sensing transcriptional regulator
VAVATGRPDWQNFAACRELGPAGFFFERGENQIHAKAVCRGCVVREDCLEYALAGKEKYGVWGGMSERQRRAIRSARAAKR